MDLDLNIDTLTAARDRHHAELTDFCSTNSLAIALAKTVATLDSLYGLLENAAVLRQEPHELSRLHSAIAQVSDYRDNIVKQIEEEPHEFGGIAVLMHLEEMRSQNAENA